MIDKYSYTLLNYKTISFYMYVSCNSIDEFSCLFKKFHAKKAQIKLINAIINRNNRLSNLHHSILTHTTYAKNPPIPSLL